MMDQTIGKILIVDDEVELKNVLVEALTAQGYEAVGFTGAAQALAALQEESFDILLTDLWLRRLVDGAQGCWRLPSPVWSLAGRFLNRFTVSRSRPGMRLSVSSRLSPFLCS